MSHQYVDCRHGIPVQSCAECTGVRYGVARTYHPQSQYILSCPHCTHGVMLTLGPYPVPKLSVVGGGDYVASVTMPFPLPRDLRIGSGVMHEDRGDVNRAEGGGLGIVHGEGEQVGDRQQRYRPQVSVSIPRDSRQGPGIVPADSIRSGAEQHGGDHQRYRSVSPGHAQGPSRHQCRTNSEAGDRYEGPSRTGRSTARRHTTRYPRNPFLD